ncbi:NUDIX hydrolase domain-like protein, partial [Baffinella frigidus]
MAARAPHIHAAAYLLLRRGSSVLLGKRWGTGWMDGKYTLPAGHVDPGERILQAAAREAREEI